MGLLLLIVILFLLFGSHPRWGYHTYSYYPMGGLGLVFFIILIILLFGRL